MSPKKFLIVFGVVSLVIWIAGNVALGPPGLSGDYLDQGQNKKDHDHYLSIIKSTPYKLYDQRPALNMAGISEVDRNFVLEYESRPALIAQKVRITRYENFFDLFNMMLLIILAVHFGKKPLLNFLDTQIALTKEKFEAAMEEHETAKTRKQTAEEKLASLAGEKAEIERETQAHLERELAELEKANQHSLSVMERETNDRKKGEAHAAAQQVKRELVRQALENLESHYQAGATEAHQAALIDQFTGDVEKLA
jgi:F0F1-type ATP synthase membrane subunit b/b'